VDSFIPLWEWDLPKKKKGKKSKEGKAGKEGKGAKADSNGTPISIDGPSVSPSPLAARLPSARIEEVPDEDA
jgi:translocation protein SEC62